jgi:hypothetical protein
MLLVVLFPAILFHLHSCYILLFWGLHIVQVSGKIHEQKLHSVGLDVENCINTGWFWILIMLFI